VPTFPDRSAASPVAPPGRRGTPAPVAAAADMCAGWQPRRPRLRRCSRRAAACNQMPRVVVSAVFQQIHQQKADSTSPCPKTEARTALSIEVRGEQLARPERLPEPVHDVEPDHLIVAELGVQAHDFLVLQPGNEHRAPAASALPNLPKTPSAPKVTVPKPSVDTRRPDRPNWWYSTFDPPRSTALASVEATRDVRARTPPIPGSWQRAPVPTGVRRSP
jgi:hypothetical protein